MSKQLLDLPINKSVRNTPISFSSKASFTDIPTLLATLMFNYVSDTVNDEKSLFRNSIIITVLIFCNKTSASVPMQPYLYSCISQLLPIVMVCYAQFPLPKMII